MQMSEVGVDRRRSHTHRRVQPRFVEPSTETLEPSTETLFGSTETLFGSTKILEPWTETLEPSTVPFDGTSTLLDVTMPPERAMIALGPSRSHEAWFAPLSLRLSLSVLHGV
jgi:hypothetical protein